MKKFRAYHPELDKFLFSEVKVSNFSELEFTALGFRGQGIPCDNWIIEQWTGLTDIAGNDIYEGDVVYFCTHQRKLSKESPMGVVIFDQGEFTIRGYEYPKLKTLLIRVIGNIHGMDQKMEARIEEDSR